MKNTKRITESELNLLVKKVIEEKKIEEGLFDGIRDAAQGLKGVWRGSGYDYYKYFSSLKGLMKKLKKLDEPNHKTMIELKSLKNRIISSKMDIQKKTELTSKIDRAVQYFEMYSNLINQIEADASTLLN